MRHLHVPHSGDFNALMHCVISDGPVHRRRWSRLLGVLRNPAYLCCAGCYLGCVEGFQKSHSWTVSLQHLVVVGLASECYLLLLPLADVQTSGRVKPGAEIPELLTGKPRNARGPEWVSAAVWRASDRCWIPFADEWKILQQRMGCFWYFDVRILRTPRPYRCLLPRAEERKERTSLPFFYMFL